MLSARLELCRLPRPVASTPPGPSGGAGARLRPKPGSRRRPLIFHPRLVRDTTLSLRPPIHFRHPVNCRQRPLFFYVFSLPLTAIQHPAPTLTTPAPFIPPLPPPRLPGSGRKTLLTYTPRDASEGFPDVLVCIAERATHREADSQPPWVCRCESHADLHSQGVNAKCSSPHSRPFAAKGSPHLFHSGIQKLFFSPSLSYYVAMIVLAATLIYVELEGNVWLLWPQ